MAGSQLNLYDIENNMFNLIFTLDYEIHGNGDGSPYKLMVEPTNRLLDLCDKYGAKLTIMADVAEILRFKDYMDKSGEDKFNYEMIIDQLKRAISTGHDVQLHIHSGYFESEYKNGKWQQNWDEYDLAKQSYQKIHERIKLCKDFLENHLKEVKSGYKCIAFRASNWSMMPTKNIYKALVENKIKIDTSVFKYGKRSGRVKFDYSSAESPIVPWFLDENDICKKDNSGKLLEIPIYCELRNFLAFISFIRIFRIIRAQFHRHEKIISSENDNLNSKPGNNSQKKKKNILKKILGPFGNKHAWKLDLNQASGRQLINAVKRIEKKFGDYNFDIPIVLIGHSKSFVKHNEKTMEQFLKYISNSPDKFRFSVFNELNFSDYRR